MISFLGTFYQSHMTCFRTLYWDRGCWGGFECWAGWSVWMGGSGLGVGLSGVSVPGGGSLLKSNI